MDMVDPSVVLAPYLEPLVRGRRVVVLGDSSGSLGAGLIDRGARLVHVYDPDPVRAAESAARLAGERSMVIARLPEADLAVRDGAFDAVIVPDLGLFERPDEIVRRAARLAGPNGAALFASRNLEVPGTKPALRGRELSYYELYDTVSLQFAEVRMLGQAPFMGYVIADFAPEDEPDVSVDTSLMEHGAEEPQWFLALASTRPVRLDAYSIVQIPSTTGAASSAASTALSGELDSARGRIGELETELGSQRAALRAMEARQVDPARVTELEEQLKKSEARAGDAHVRAGRLEGKVRDLEEELRHQRDRAFRLSRELEDEKKAHTRAELELSIAKRTSELPRPIEEQPPPAPVVDEKIVAELETEKTRSARLQRELDDAHARIAELASDLTSARDELDDARAVQTHHAERVRELEAALRERDKRIVQLDGAVLELEQSAAEAASKPSRDEEIERALRERDEVQRLMTQMRTEQENEIGRLEEKLRDRGGEIEKLRQESARKDQLVRELVVVFEEARLQGAEGTPGQLVDTIASLHGQLDRLAAVAAQRESELQASEWRVQQLEQQVAERGQQEPSDDVANLERALAAAQSELDALRKSLAQEHEARERLESGSGMQEALADAHAELQQQAVLVSSAEPPEPGSVDR